MKCFSFSPFVFHVQILLKKREPLNYPVPDGSAGFSSRLAASQDMMTFSPPSVSYRFISSEASRRFSVTHIQNLCCLKSLGLSRVSTMELYEMKCKPRQKEDRNRQRVGTPVLVLSM